MRPGRIDAKFLACLALAAAACGCHGGPGRRGEHASVGLLNPGRAAKVSRRQAADVQFAMARTLEQSGDVAGAEAAYREALAKDPRRADAEARLAVMAEEQGDSKRADEHFERALKLAPRDPDLLCDRGYSLYLRRRWADAEASLRKAVKEDPRHARAHNNLGLVLARRGDREEALAEFAKAGCDRPDALANLALATAMEGRIEDARGLYAEVVAAKPGSPAARNGLRAADSALAARHTPDVNKALVGVIPPPKRFDPAVTRTSGLRGD